MKFTYGQEQELSDIDRNTPLPENLYYSEREFDIVNSDGRAIDPSGKVHTIGGEINFKWSHTIDEQIEMYKTMLATFPNATINHRAHHHFHISWDGIKEDLNGAKRILKYWQENADFILNKCFNPTKHPDMNNKAWAYQIIDRYKIPDWKYEFCMNATDMEDFLKSFAKVKDGTVLYQTMKRGSLNFYSIKKHGTIEFRHFFETLDPEVVRSTFQYCEDFVVAALSNKDIKSLPWDTYNFPKEAPYNKFIEESWQTGNYKK